MKVRQTASKPTGVMIWLTLTLWSTACCAEQRLYAFERPQLGTIVTVKLLSDSKHVAKASAERAFAKIESLQRIFTDYETDSEVRQLAASESSAYDSPTSISKPLSEVLDHAQQISRRTGGAFDVTVGPLVRLWRRAARTKEAPSEQRIQEALASVGYRHLELSQDAELGPAIFLARPNMRLDLGGIAKGYIADAALAVLVESGHRIALVDAGGDLALGDAPPGQRGWRIGMAADTVRRGNTEPGTGEFLELSNCGVATSGDAERGFEIDGVRFSHVVDPRTGSALRDAWATTVVAGSCMQADAYASAAMVLGPAIQDGLDRSVKITFVDSERAALHGRETIGERAARQFAD